MREVIGLFLRLGLTAFGGPAAHVALMEEQVVRRLGWLTHEEFLDLFGLANLLPGPSSTELAIFLGHRRAGWRGLLAGGVCFVLPAMLLVMVLAAVYVHWGSLPAVGGVLYGVKPVVLAVIVQALWSLGGRALKTRPLAVAGLLAAGLTLAGVGPVWLMFGLGLASGLAGWWRVRASVGARPALSLVAACALFMLAPWAITQWVAVGGPVTPGSLCALFAKVGSVLYGGGYVLIAFLRDDLVTRLHWLTNAQLLDAIAVGQVTPGPLFTTATFIGYVLLGVKGAVLATVGIFAPSLVFVGVAGPLLPRLRGSAVMSAFLDGLNAAALGLMAAVGVQLAQAALVGPLAVGLALAAAVALLRYGVNSMYVVLAGAAMGLLTS